MPLPAIQPDELPSQQRSKLLEGESVYHFGYIDFKGGCAQASTAKQWILVTDKRILFEASVKEGPGASGKFLHQSGTIPMPKVSYVGMSTSKEGCSQKETNNLRINSSGGEIILAIPSQREAEKIQKVIDEVLAASK